MKNSFGLALIFIATNLLSQPDSEFCDLVPDWDEMVFMSDPISDTFPKLLIVTSRPYVEENKKGEFFPNEISKYRKVTYLEAACTGEKWIMHSMKNFEESMKTVDNEKDMLLFVHGHGKSLPLSLPRALAVKKRYDVSLILFDWPAKNSNLNKSFARVRRCGENFYNLLLNLKAYRETKMNKNQSLNILAHSVGNYFLTHFVVNGNWQYLNDPFIDNIVFNAPAVRSKEHGEAMSLINISKNKYVVLNKNDMILRSANMLTSGKMLGNKVIQPYATNTKYIDFTNVAGRKHTYFAGHYQFEDDNKSVYKTYNLLFHGLEPDVLSQDFDALSEYEFMLK